MRAGRAGLEEIFSRKLAIIKVERREGVFIGGGDCTRAYDRRFRPDLSGPSVSRMYGPRVVAAIIDIVRIITMDRNASGAI